MGAEALPLPAEHREGAVWSFRQGLWCTYHVHCSERQGLSKQKKPLCPHGACVLAGKAQR